MPGMGVWTPGLDPGSEEGGLGLDSGKGEESTMGAEVSTSVLQQPKRPPKARMRQRKCQRKLLLSQILQSPPKVRCPLGLCQLSPPGPSAHWP